MPARLHVKAKGLRLRAGWWLAQGHRGSNSGSGSPTPVATANAARTASLGVSLSVLVFGPPGQLHQAWLLSVQRPHGQCRGSGFLLWVPPQPRSKQSGPPSAPRVGVPTDSRSLGETSPPIQAPSGPTGAGAARLALSRPPSPCTKASPGTQQTQGHPVPRL